MKASALAPALALLLSVAACGGGDAPPAAPPASSPPAATPLPLPSWVNARLLGGATTNEAGNQSSSGFDTPALNLDAEALARHLRGDSEFNRNFIRGPSAEFPSNDGLGPAFNNTSCISCHIRDGRASFPLAALQAPLGQWTQLGPEAGIFLRLGLTGTGTATGTDPDGTATASGCVGTADNNYCAPTPVPGFGTQLVHRGVLGLRPDSPFSGLADFFVRFEEKPVSYADGTTVTLRRPVFQMRNPWDSPGEVPGDRTTPLSRLLQPDVVVSPRNGLPMIGLGLLEAIPDAAILALEDPADLDGDGISGRANRVHDPIKAQRGDFNPVSLGRFGWKASTPSVQVQSANAYRDDMGITNRLFPQESIAGLALYTTYRASHPDDDGEDGHEVSDDVLDVVSFYANTLAVPARRLVDDPTVQRGAALFESVRCSACHHPAFTTGTHPGVWTASGNIAIATVSDQVIYPFSDMLLHDMGEDLADHRSDYLANGREWRTRPLWGIGLTLTVNGLASFLHDGRARTIEEAILWHGGEAAAAQQAFRQLGAADRAALLAFLNSL